MATEDIDLDDPREEFDPETRKTTDDDAEALPPEVEEAVDCLKLVMEAEDDQRDLEDEDLSFDAGEQWPEEIKLSRGKQVIDGIEIPPRPMLTIPKLDQPVQLVINQQRRSHLGIRVSAASEDADRQTADIIAGIVRHIQHRSNAEIARNWAFERATKAGRGYYRILARYCDHQGTGYHWSDQELVIKRILNQGSVYLDPYATEPDWSDGMWGLIGGWVAAKIYKQRWPHSKLAAILNAGDKFDEDQANIAPAWMSNDINGKGLQGVRVMEFFKVVEKTRYRFAYRDAQDSNKLIDEYRDFENPKARSEFAKSLGERLRAQRETSERSVKWCKLNGLEVLEEERWPGQWIPIIPVIGREQFFKNLRRWVGMIRPAKDGQRLFNYSATAAVEKEALDTKAPYIGYEGQFKGHEEAWSQSATRNFPYLQVAPVTIGGRPAPFPKRNVAGPNLDGSLSLLAAADNFIKATTFTYDPSLGNRTESSESGRKVLALQQQSDQGNSHYLDNLETVSMPHEARVLLDLIPHYYDRSGRMVTITGANEDESEVIVNAPFIIDQNTGRPRMVPKEVADNPSVRPRNIKTYDLRKGSYTAVANVGKTYESRLREGSDEIARVLDAAPELVKIIGDIYFKFRDFPGHEEIAERFKKMLPPELQDDQNPDDPKALKAKLGQMQSAMQELQQAFGEAMKDLETQRVQAMAKVESEKIKAESAERLAAIELHGERMLAEIDANLKVQIAAIESQLDLRTKAVDIAAEREAREDEQRHEVAMSQMESAMDSDLQAAAHDQAMESLGAEHDHETHERVGEHEFEAARTTTEADREDQRAEADREHESTEAERTRQHETERAEEDDAGGE